MQAGCHCERERAHEQRVTVGRCARGQFGSDDACCPARLSTTSGCPSVFATCSPIVRVITSFGPPGGYGTITRIGRIGYGCSRGRTCARDDGAQQMNNAPRRRDDMLFRADAALFDDFRPACRLSSECAANSLCVLAITSSPSWPNARPWRIGRRLHCPSIERAQNFRWGCARREQTHPALNS